MTCFLDIIKGACVWYLTTDEFYTSMVSIVIGQINIGVLIFFIDESLCSAMNDSRGQLVHKMMGAWFSDNIS